MARKRTGGVEVRDGRVYARITVTLEDGRKVRRRVRLDDNTPKRLGQREARKLAREAEGFVFQPRKGSRRKAAPVAALTLDDYHEAWAADRERRGRVSERGRYTKHIAPVLGTKKVQSITKDNIRALCDDLDEKVLASEIHWTTAVKIWGIATKMFSDACESKVAALRVRTDNPCADVPGPDRGEKKAKQWLYPSEMTTLLACADVPLRWRRLYALAVYLYVRPGELAALEWADVNTESKYVLIHQALDLRTGETKPTKTGITRKVPIRPELEPLLDAMRAESGGQGRVIQHTHANKDALHGFPPLEDLAATLRAHLARAGVNRADLSADRATTKRITFYDLRATGITWEVLAGTDHVQVMVRAGHKNFSTTLVYIREAEAIGYAPGEPFPALPESLQKAPRKGPVSDSGVKTARIKRKRGRPQRDSNPCYSLERAVSWAWLDDGD